METSYLASVSFLAVGIFTCFHLVLDEAYLMMASQGISIAEYMSGIA